MTQVTYPAVFFSPRPTGQVLWPICL